MVRIKDIAKEANVSEGTVDRVIHNRGGVSSKTEAKIRKILKERNFTLNPVASALAKLKPQNIAVLLPEYSDSNQFWKSPFLGVLKAKKEVNDVGINVDCYHFNQYDPKSYIKAFKKLIKTKPSAVIFVPLFISETRRLVKELEKLQIKYFFLNVDVDGFNNETFIGQDSYTAGYIAGKLMRQVSSPHNSYLIIQSKNISKENNAIMSRITGFKDYLLENSPEPKIATLTIEDLSKTREAGKKISDFLNSENTIKGIFVPSSRVSSVIELLKPEQIKSLSLIGFDNTPQNIECLRNNSVSFLISQKPFDQGYDSIHIMTDYLIKNKKPDQKIYLSIDILTKENFLYNDRKQLEFENEFSEDLKNAKGFYAKS